MINRDELKPDQARFELEVARRAVRSGRARLAAFSHGLVDRHTRFMAFVWGPDWQLGRDGIPETQAFERRR